MRLLYFAWVREKAGKGQEEVAPPAEVADVAGLIAWLRSRGGGPADALADLRLVRVAVNQEYVALDHPVGGSDEVAFFPPVTGG
ncbi:MAG: molybdopterin converting factor subunit 1 [Rhodospirillales bacterium]|nr:molybdopterin converting factor subunit 1 [Rhodospirillales bacterium]